MAKKRMLTVLVPIEDSDCVHGTYTDGTLPTVNSDNINKIYKMTDGTYRRVWLNPETGMYEYHTVVDREFPELGRPLEIFNFTYDATRMGNAPTISAQGVMWYADKDTDGNDVTLEDKWIEYGQSCHVIFNGETFALSQIPTSSKDDSEDARYKYDIDFVSDIVVLEHVYFFDVVEPFVTEKPISENATFDFFGDINELAKRINASMIRSGISSLVEKTVIHEWGTPPVGALVPHVTYKEWNDIGFEDHRTPRNVLERVYIEERGNYNTYLQKYVYVNDNGDYTLNGYKVIIGKDKYGNDQTSEEKLVSVDKNYIHDILQEVKNTFELEYYVVKERDGNGDLTGNTFIVIGDCEHDFADMNAGGTDYVRDDDGVPTTEHPFDYGVDDALISKEKTNTTEKIVTRITGVGSSENIPWYYPNPTPDGWIEPEYHRLDNIINNSLDYPLSEGSTVPDNNRYEKFLKNRVGNDLVYGHIVDVFQNYEFDQSHSSHGWNDTDSSDVSLTFRYVIRARTNDGENVINPSLEMKFTIPDFVTKYIIRLTDNTAGTFVEYDSTSTYSTPNEFQQICAAGATGANYALTSGHIYYLSFQMWVASRPDAQRADEVGYLYPSNPVAFPSADGTNYIIQDFYKDDTLTEGTLVEGVYPNVFLKLRKTSLSTVCYCGYCKNNVAVSPIVRVTGSKYKDITIDTNTGLPKNKVYLCTSSYYGDLNAYEVMKMEVDEWVSTYFSFYAKLWSATGFWYVNNSKKTTLAEYGMSIAEQSSVPVVTPAAKDIISFKRVKYITPQSTLMPEIYIKTDGERRFYNAKKYPVTGGTPDTAAGETASQGQIVNSLYENDSQYYDFENEYLDTQPKEDFKEFEDIKPSIKEMYQPITITADQFNADKSKYYVIGQSGQYRRCTENDIYNSSVTYYLRIDIVEEFAFDETDNDEIWESDSADSGEYKHPYFYAKLRPLGFNIFDLALQEDMVLSMTTGHCGACNFKIGVDESTKKNPVEIWEYNVYGGYDYAHKGSILYHAGDLRRYVDTSSLYYDTDGTQDGYIPVDKKVAFSAENFSITGVGYSVRQTFERTVYTSDMVVDGYVGSLKRNNRIHFEGDVKIGKFCDAQQDTSENYVWIALYKDTDTYGTIMPSARPDYSTGVYSVYIEPKGHIYTDRATGQTSTLTDDEADNFVLTNIRMPQVYLRNAEHELSRKLVAEMYENNYQKFNFSMNFSRIFLAENLDIESLLNENSVVYVNFNKKVYRQYVKQYTYKMSEDEVLPEITVAMNEELSVSRTANEKINRSIIDITSRNNRKWRKMLDATEEYIGHKSIGRNEDVLVGGNIVSRDGSTSFSDIDSFSRDAKSKMSSSEDYTKGFVQVVNDFNSDVDVRLKQIRYTMEQRVLPDLPDVVDNQTCSASGINKYYFESPDYPSRSMVAKFWLTDTGEEQTYTMPSSTAGCQTDQGMTDITWTNY